MRQDGRQALRKIKRRVRVHAFTRSGRAFEAMLDQSLDEEDIERAVSTSRLLETRQHSREGTCYVLRGFAMNENEVLLICRLERDCVEILDLFWA